MYDVPNELTTESIIEDIHEFTIREIMSLQEFRRSMKVVSRTGREDNLKGNLIVECTSKVYTKILTAGKVYLAYSPYKVRESNIIPTCLKCYAFGHQIWECKAAERVCKKCGIEGHHANECCQLQNV